MADSNNRIAQASERPPRSVIRDAYYWVFYSIYQFDPWRSDRFDRRWRALASLCIVEIWVWSSLEFGFAMLERRFFLFGLPKPLIVAVAVAIMLLNYFATLHHRRWERYARRFDRTPSRVRKRAMTIAWASVAMAAAMEVCSMYAYRRSAASIEIISKLHQGTVGQ